MASEVRQCLNVCQYSKKTFVISEAFLWILFLIIIKMVLSLSEERKNIGITFTLHFLKLIIVII